MEESKLQKVAAVVAASMLEPSKTMYNQYRDVFGHVNAERYVFDNTYHQARALEETTLKVTCTEFTRHCGASWPNLQPPLFCVAWACQQDIVALFRDNCTVFGRSRRCVTTGVTSAKMSGPMSHTPNEATTDETPTTTVVHAGVTGSSGERVRLEGAVLLLQSLAVPPHYS